MNQVQKVLATNRSFDNESQLPLDSPDPAICLETLIRLCYLRHGFENADMMAAIYLHQIAFNAVKQLQDFAIGKPRSSFLSQPDDVRSSLLLAAIGLYAQGTNYNLPNFLFRLVHNDMAEDDRALLATVIPSAWHRSNPVVEQQIDMFMQSQYPFSMVKMTDDPESVRIGKFLQGAEASSLH
jgi:hypothetical protein